MKIEQVTDDHIIMLIIIETGKKKKENKTVSNKTIARIFGTKFIYKNALSDTKTLVLLNYIIYTTNIF